MTREDSSDRIEFVSLADQIDRSVEDAAREAEDDRVDAAPTLDIVRTHETPLETVEAEPKPAGELWPETPPAEVDRRRKKRLQLALGAALVVAIAAAVGIFTTQGRKMLPRDMQRPARQIADDVERRAAEAAGDAFYTFTDKDGVVHIVDSLDKVPPEYRRSAKRKY